MQANDNLRLHLTPLCCAAQVKRELLNSMWAYIHFGAAADESASAGALSAILHVVQGRRFVGLKLAASLS